MYLPPHFREDRLERQHGLIRENPLGLLVTAGPGGLIANPLVFLVDPDRGEFGTLRAHLARGNPQWRELLQVDDCMVVFNGPQRYISPSWYPSKHEHGKAVPTWNFITVHAWGKPQVIENEQWLRLQIDDLTHAQEDRLPEPWQVEDAPADYVDSLLGGIVGLEIPVRRIEGKWKVSQNRPQADRQGVVQALRAQGGPEDPMAALVERYDRPAQDA